MRINKVAFIGKGGVGLLYGSMIARALGICQGMDAVFLNNELTYGRPGEIRFGAASDTDPAVVADIADLYSRAGIAHMVEPDIKRRMWTKLMMNVGINQTCMV